MLGFPASSLVEFIGVVMIKKLLQMKNARLILGFALLIIVLSVLFGLQSFEAEYYPDRDRIFFRCSSAWWPKQQTDFGVAKTSFCDFAASSRRYTIYFVATATFSILAGGLLISERLRKKV